MTEISYTPNGLIRWASIKFGGEKPKELERFIKFFVVGIIGFVIDFGTLNILQSSVLSPESNTQVLLASSIAFTAAVTSNFIWNRYWTYPDSRTSPILQQLTQFFIVNIAGLLFRLVTIALLYSIFGSIGATVINAMAPDTVTTLEAQNQLGTNLAQVLAVFIVMFWNFFANRYWTYNDID